MRDGEPWGLGEVGASQGVLLAKKNLVDLEEPGKLLWDLPRKGTEAVGNFWSWKSTSVFSLREQ
jgi:hypothetical protein